MNGFFFNRTLRLYSAFLYERDIVEVPDEYVEIARKVMEKIGWHTRVSRLQDDNGAKTAKITNISESTDNKVMLALSGGLDSTYFLYRLKDAGYDVTAVHVTGLNRSAAKAEAEQARKIAREAGAHFVSVKFNTPKQVFPDNPFKNQLILSMMLGIGVRRGITKYAVGSDWTTPLAEAVTGYTITDSIEVNREYWEGVKRHFPEAELVFIDEETKKYQRLQYLYLNHFTALNQVSSCIAPFRFRTWRHGQNIAKYGVTLLEGRCGSCYKCCMEYILLVEAGLVPKDDEYYDHCWHILANSETSHRPDLFDEKIPLQKRLENLKNYGS